MIKTIKVKKQLRLDELIKYAFDNNIKNVDYVSSGGGIVRFNTRGHFELDELFFIKADSIFTAEVEEEITELTRFNRAIALTLSPQGGVQLYSHDYENLTLGKILNSNNHRDLHQVYAMIDGKLELIWS